MVGDFDPDEIRPLLEKTLSGWTARQPYERLEKIVFDKVPGGRQQILTPDKANAVYFAGESFALSDSDPDYAPLALGSFIFGGALSRRDWATGSVKRKGCRTGLAHSSRPTRSIGAAVS